MREVDVFVAGQGAAGYAASLYLARYRLETVICGEVFGGETATGGIIENYPGTPEIDGLDLMFKFKEQVESLEVPILDTNLESLEKKDGRFICRLKDKTEFLATSVILAIGRKRRTLNLPNEQEWTGLGVSYCTTCDAPLYRNKQAAGVVGGGNAAVEGAILLAKYAKEVFLIYRGESLFRPEPILITTLKNTPNIKVLYNTNVVELIGDDKGLSGIRISKAYEGKDTLILDGLFVEAGADPLTGIPKSVGAEISSSTGEVHVSRTQATNVKGLYAAGDLTDGSALKQTITAASQGAIAAQSAYQYVTEYRAKG